MRNISVIFSVGCLFAASWLGGRELPPAAPPPKPVLVPAPAVRLLPNGLSVVALERHNLPIVTLTLAIRTGAEADPPQLPGTAQLVASLLGEGTKHRSAQQIAEAIDDAGGTIDTGAEWDDSYATLSFLSDHTQLAFDLLSDIVLNPAFAPDEVERVRKQTLSALDILRHDPGYLADTLLERLIFWGTPYSHPSSGVEESVRRLTPSDLRQFHALYYQPANAVLVAVGDVTSVEVHNMAQKFFGGWRGAEPLPSPAVHIRPRLRPWQVTVIDDPNAVQTEIRIANVAVGRDDPNYDALVAANQVLGGPAENLLFSDLRSRRGLVYGASSDLVCYRHAGAWETKTATRTNETFKTVQLILDLMKRLHDHAVSRQDLLMAQDYLIGHMALDFETSQDIAEQLLELMIYHLPLDYWTNYPAGIRSLTTDQVWDATRRYLDPQQAAIVLVGNASRFKKDLKQLGSVRIIPLADVGLASAALESPSGPAVSSHQRLHAN